MDLQASMSKSATNFTDNELGYSLKKRKLRQWIYLHQLTQPYVAKRMGMEQEEFQAKLNEGAKFNREQITGLVELMGARDAFDVLYFPTAEQREEVYQKTFGSCLNSQESDVEESTDEEPTEGQKVFRKDEEAELIYLFENEKPMRNTFPDWYFTDSRYTINHSNRERPRHQPCRMSFEIAKEVFMDDDRPDLPYGDDGSEGAVQGL